VFGDVAAATAGDVLVNWERDKHARNSARIFFEGSRRHARTSEGRQGRAQAGGHGAGLDGDGLDARALVAGLAGMLVLTDPEAKTDPDTAAAVGSLLLEEARLVAHWAKIPSCSFARRSTGWEQSWPWPRRPARGTGADLASLDPAFASSSGARRTPNPEVPGRASDTLAQFVSPLC